MSKINFVGLVCFIRQQDGYLVALPNGTRASYPCGSGLLPHHAYLIVPQKDIITSSVSGTPHRNCLVVRLNPDTDIRCALAEQQGTLDDAGMAKGIHWSDLDPTFSPNAAKAFARMTIRQGTLDVGSLPAAGGSADAAVMTTLTLSAAENLVIDVNEGSITMLPGSEIVIGNAGANWINNPYDPDNEDDFFIYYDLNDSASAGCRKPKAHPLPMVISTNPYLLPPPGGPVSDGLHVDCSNTIYP